MREVAFGFMIAVVGLYLDILRVLVKTREKIRGGEFHGLLWVEQEERRQKERPV